ncbi:hypothetical protein HK100_008114 [Physocladia obscura]|uniref:Uncharacterized protein n=1 Tax=Physocladia obscura TaxID=109957 RepID=A0AAD5TAZ9_9FUNG|nr:hypothetical protein HK100_008114 [Physocladia obscura]
MVSVKRDEDDEEGHFWVTDRVIIRTGILAKGDVYHTAGFFQVCGNCDFVYVPETDLIKPGRRYNWTCEPVEEWADRFKAVFENYTETTWYQEAGPAKTLVVASRWLEGISTALDMIFGITSIWMVMYPERNERKNRRNFFFAVAGIMLAPALTIIDSQLSKTWDALYIATALDLVLQISFLNWGIRRNFALTKASKLNAEAGAHDAGDSEVGVTEDNRDKDFENIELDAIVGDGKKATVIE